MPVCVKHLVMQLRRNNTTHHLPFVIDKYNVLGILPLQTDTIRSIHRLVSLPKLPGYFPPGHRGFASVWRMTPEFPGQFLPTHACLHAPLRHVPIVEGWHLFI